jgi:hypothetical protein
MLKQIDFETKQELKELEATLSNILTSTKFADYFPNIARDMRASMYSIPEFICGGYIPDYCTKISEERYILINKYGDIFYYKDKEMKVRHRTDGPAVISHNGTVSYYLNNEFLSNNEFIRATLAVEVTMQEIADKFGIPVNMLKIKK